MTKRRIKKNVFIVGGKAPDVDADAFERLRELTGELIAKVVGLAGILDMNLDEALKGESETQANIQFFEAPKIAGDRELFKGSNGK